jgi:hypothetical protein
MTLVVVEPVFDAHTRFFLKFHFTSSLIRWFTKTAA